MLLAIAAPARAAEAQIATGPIRQCASVADVASCRAVQLDALPLSEPEVVLARTVTVAPRTLPLARPLMVWVIATASSEISWNGVPIGRNGVPGADAAHERPGRFIATFVVPGRLVRPGENLVSARLSAHHLPLPVRRAVQEFDVGPYAAAGLPGLFAYLPALLMLGALLAACLYFAAAVLLDPADRGARLLAATAALLTVQLAVETARTFVSYPYPWQIVRLAAIALLSALVGLLAALYAAQRFAPGRLRSVAAATGAACLACLLLLPWYDIKALGALGAGMLAILYCGWRGRRDGVRGGGVAAGAALIFFALLAWQGTRFLDQAYYLFAAALLVGLVAEQSLTLRGARRARDVEEARARGLEEQLRRLSREPTGAVASLKDGARTHRIPEDEILFARAADDYSEVQLKDGRALLVTMTLARLQAVLSLRFVRIHKSYMVNAACVATVAPRPGGGRTLVLSNGATLPVGRAYLDAVAAMEAGSAVAGADTVRGAIGSAT